MSPIVPFSPPRAYQRRSLSQMAKRIATTKQSA